MYQRKKKNKFTEMCCELSYARVVGYNITPNQSDLDLYLEEQFGQGYFKKLLKIMENSNIEHCENNKDDKILYKYKDMFASILSKQRVYSATFRNLQKNI